MFKWMLAVGVAAMSLAGSSGLAAEILLPQMRTAYYAGEPIEVAVSGLGKDQKATVEITPVSPVSPAPSAPGAPAAHAAPASVRFEVLGDGGAVTTVVPAFGLAPGQYTLSLDGIAAKTTLAIASGVGDSTMRVSQSDRVADIRAGGGNFVLGNMAGGGLVDADGKPAKNIRQLSAWATAFNSYVAADLPDVIYQYWTGYITHKPWGRTKSWESQPESDMMRMFNFHVAQRLRRFAGDIAAIGTLDEPGLNWGKNPNGVWASGFANWDGAPWYSQRGWEWKDDPTAGSVADWKKYMDIRTSIIGEHQAQAKKDLQTVWPGVVFSADNYAVDIAMDGADTFNGRANDIPCTHVFLDWGYGRAAAGSAIYLEKAYDPTAKTAHAMNGRLFGSKPPLETSVNMYRVMMNAMLQSGLYSNWWLNFKDMTTEALSRVNTPARQMGPLLREMTAGDRDVAVLWSHTEAIMRPREITAQAAHLTAKSEPIQLMIASVPENTAMKDGQLKISAYNIGFNYRNQVIDTHAALLRAGYPAHIVDERVLEPLLKNYKVLVITGQTFELPEAVRKTIADFQAAGGKVVVDKTTAVKIDNAIVTEADFRDIGFRWSVLFNEAGKCKVNQDGTIKNESKFATAREASSFQTNYFMDSFIRSAVAPTRAALKQTAARAAAITEDEHLVVERHVGGAGAAYLVLNAYDELPAIADDQAHCVYNYAPHVGKFTLQGIAPGSCVYLIEGTDWGKVSKVADFDKPQSLSFEAGEMKVFLVAPQAPAGIAVQATGDGRCIEVQATLQDVHMPWPLVVKVAGPDGSQLYKVYRSMDANGQYKETFPIGANAGAGDYAVSITSPAGPLTAEAKAAFKTAPAAPARISEAVRVFDANAILAFLAAKPKVTIAVGVKPELKAAADKLCQQLKDKGIEADVENEKAVFTRSTYPRVWDPYVKVVKRTDQDKKPSDEVRLAVMVETSGYGDNTAKAMDANSASDVLSGAVKLGPNGEIIGNWARSGALVTVGPKGYVDIGGDGEVFYEPGCKFYLPTAPSKRSQPEYLNCELDDTAKATDEMKQKLARPWTRLSVYNGAYNLVPQLPEAYCCTRHLILLGDSEDSELVAALQASELLPQVVDGQYPGPGKALVTFAWSPFGLEKNVILVGATDEAGLAAGIAKLVEMAK